MITICLIAAGIAFSEEASLKPLISRVLNSVSFGWVLGLSLSAFFGEFISGDDVIANSPGIGPLGALG